MDEASDANAVAAIAMAAGGDGDPISQYILRSRNIAAKCSNKIRPI
jgi:hypothetical protein